MTPNIKGVELQLSDVLSNNAKEMVMRQRWWHRSYRIAVRISESERRAGLGTSSFQVERRSFQWNQGYSATGMASMRSWKKAKRRKTACKIKVQNITMLNKLDKLT